MTNRAALLNLIEKSKKTTSSFSAKCPEGLEPLDFQNAGVEYALNFDNVLIADEPGLGKTIQSILICNERGHKRIGVICPSALKIAPWVREIKKWTTLKDAEVLVLNKEVDIPFGFEGYVVMSFEFASKTVKFKGKPKPVHLKYLMDLELETVIIDEIHKLKSPTAKRTKLILAKNGLRTIVKNWTLLSGTPIENRPIELFTILKALLPKVLGDMDYIKFAYKFCGAYQMDINGRTVLNTAGATNLKNLAARLRAYGMVRRSKSVVLKQLPSKRRNIVFVSDKIPGKFAKYKFSPKLVKEQDVDFMGLSEQRSELGEYKAPLGAKYIDELLQSGHEKIIVFAIHKVVVGYIVDYFKERGIGVASITGSTSQGLRVKAQDMFQNNKNVRVFVGNIQAAGVGITLTASNYVVIVEPDWTPGGNEQAEDRAHRIGQNEQVIVDYLVVPDTLDEHILKKVIQKEENIRGALNG